MAAKLSSRDLVDALRVKPGSRVRLRDEEAGRTFGWNKDQAENILRKNASELDELQYRLYADGRFAVLVVIQAIDAGGKDGTIRNVMSAFNPQGCVVTSFKAPTSEELRHDFLWRVHKHVPERGMIGVFNRSHYEDVLVVRVDNLVPKEVWSGRYEQINAFERMLSENSVTVVKVFLQISKDEQRRRLEARLQDPTKHWKFSPEDLEKRKQWKDYQRAFEDALTECSTKHAPWYVIPADHKWFRNLAVAQILRNEIGKLPLRFPKPGYDPAKIRIP